VVHASWAAQHSKAPEQCPKSIGFEVASMLLCNQGTFKAVIAVLRGGAVEDSGADGGVALMGQDGPLEGAGAGRSDTFGGADGLVELRLDETGPSVDIRYAGPAPILADLDDIGQVNVSDADGGAVDAGARDTALRRLE